jgi:hypothetical protein
MPQKPKGSRASLRTPILISLLNLCIGVVGTFAVSFTGWFLSHRSDSDFQQRIAGLAAGWLPFMLSLIVAFIPSQEKRRRAHMIWRVSLIAAGLFTSAVMWYNQSLSIESSRRDQERLVMTAVARANEHTDTEVGMVRDDLKKATVHSDEQVAAVRSDLKGAAGTLAELFSKTESNLNISIGKVGKPDPPVPPNLQFTLWSDDTTAPFPLKASAVRADRDGAYHVEFSLVNASETAARSVDVWIDICDECSFVKEPSGFDRPSGMRGQTRHMMFNLMNPSTSIPKQAVDIKLLKVFATFEVQLRYSCDGCKTAPPQKATLVALPFLPIL